MQFLSEFFFIKLNYVSTTIVLELQKDEWSVPFIEPLSYTFLLKTSNENTIFKKVVCRIAKVF